MGVKYEEDSPNRLLMAKFEGLQERPHENKELAVVGHKQWLYSKKHEAKSNASQKREITGTKQCDASM